MSLRQLVLVAATVGLLLTGGCASVPLASIEQDSEAKTFRVPVGKASIYVYRHENMGSAIRMPVLLDGKWVGDTAANTYILLTVDQGNHTLISKTENDSMLYVKAEADQAIFVWQEVKMGMWTARSELQLVDPEKARKDLAECKLIVSSQQ